MNFTVTLILVLIAVIVTLGAVVYVLAKRIKEIKKEKSDLQNRLESARVNVEQLSKYIDKVLKIKSDEKSISQKIKEAESDEEVYNIIADIIADNNNRVQNNQG
jgi:Na+-transporting methylmalonyl-CoA/oxaloacetate decarboxylase gamma subunit